MRQIILDTETTGLSPKEGHRIIEFAGLEMIDRKLTGNFLHLYIHPERDIDPEAERVHGISLQSLEGKPVFKQVATQLADFLRDAELIIHNAPFDVGFLDHEFSLVGGPDMNQLCSGVTDTLKMAREMYPGKKASLDVLCDRFEIDRSNRTLHGALIDCELLSEVYLAMTRGQHSLDMESVSTDNHQDGSLVKIARPEHLVILKATEEELQAHQAYLEKLDKAAGEPCLYRQQEEATGHA
ncbi:DNA polymerase III subunit epsilon [Neisseria sp. Ec49-e6-T10]|uniref:DNA polymerase III subunit epsilon n=1 Tax=Neisseria sp. Ec49-e6-T10 TaxID=3140744 RepID=UPI003EBD2D35